MSALFLFATFLSWSKSCVAVSRLFAVVARVRGDSGVGAFPCFGDILNIDLTIRYFNSTES